MRTKKRRVREGQKGLYSPTIKDLPSNERPRERLLNHGPTSLSTPELLAIILSTGRHGEMVTDMARNLLLEFGGLWGLARASIADLCARKGLKQAKVSQLKAALELARRLRQEEPEERLQIRSPADVADLLLLEMAILEQEQFRVILLDTKNRLIAVRRVYDGSLNASLIRVGEVFKEAVRQNAAAIIIVHNHPSGDPAPSSEDIQVTAQIVAAGRLLDIEVLDHLIIAGQHCLSLKEKGLGFA
ncbi:MAG: DNA repair protein RadC [Chloroflexi bacterium]|nr:DNA repair protein RadC [Chloroflexota bacterium]MCL5075685.1 DNA repair protein RadC [Chloroflexota bacterium]